MKVQDERAGELYAILVTVQPSPEHPLFWEMEDGILTIFLTGRSLEEARDRALTIIEQLPYEIIKETADAYLNPEPREADGVSPNLRDAVIDYNGALCKAREIGFGIALLGCATGSE